MVNLSAYSPERPILLVTDYPPDAGGGGAVILRSLLSAEDRARVVWASPSLDPGASSRADGGVPLVQGSHSLARWLRRRSVTVDSLLSPRLATEIEDLARRRNATAIWIVMHGAMVHAAARLVGRTRLPVHLTVHDDPPYGVALMSRRHVALIPLIARDLGRALRRAQSVDVISDGMASRYRSLYGVNSVVVHRGMTQSVVPSPPFDPSNGLAIAVLGNTYGYEQLLTLANAIAQADARLRVRGRLVVIGRGHGERLRKEIGQRMDVEVTGHLDEAAAVERLRTCFLLYLNYPFSPRAAVLRETSFPTKLSTYLLAARPILLHAPPGSSTSPLAELAGYVVPWTNDRSADGADLIVRAWNDVTTRESAHVAAEATRRRYYDLEENRATLFAALNRLAPGR
jgi:glycosyltransferase involved in cell wall biosynthesis